MTTKILSICLCGLLIASCSSIKIIKASEGEQVLTTNFKTEIPFEFPRKESILIPVSFNKEAITRKLKFDNHAPSSLSISDLKNNKAFSYVGKFPIGKPTPDGKTIDNLFYLTDSVQIGSVNINHILINGIPDRKATDTTTRYDGLFGSNLLVKGIWKVDFEHNRIFLVSNIDSLTGMTEATTLPARFTGIGNIVLDVSFENGIQEKVDVDFGYNGPIMLPKKTFDKIDVQHKATSKKGILISAGGTTETTKYNLDSAKIVIGGIPFNSTIRSSDNMRSSLIGLAFFSKYRFVVLDYINNKIYLAK
jgi:predicted aspartyl protease